MLIELARDSGCRLVPLFLLRGPPWQSVGLGAVREIRSTSRFLFMRSSLFRRLIPCSGRKISLFHIAGNSGLQVRNRSGIRADTRGRQAETVEIPCIFPVIREMAAETSSRRTPPTAIESFYSETLSIAPSVGREKAVDSRGFARWAFAEANRGDSNSRVDRAPFDGFLCW